jgi:hypothetical protein
MPRICDICKYVRPDCHTFVDPGLRKLVHLCGVHLKDHRPSHWIHRPSDLELLPGDNQDKTCKICVLLSPDAKCVGDMYYMGLDPPNYEISKRKTPHFFNKY